MTFDAEVERVFHEKLKNGMNGPGWKAFVRASTEAGHPVNANCAACRDAFVDVADFPIGSVLLSQNDAAHVITIGDHPSSDKGGVDMQVAIISLLRAGLVVAIRLKDGQLAFRAFDA